MKEAGDVYSAGRVSVLPLMKRDTKTLSEKCLRLNSHMRCDTKTPDQWVIFSVDLKPRYAVKKNWEAAAAA